MLDAEIILFANAYSCPLGTRCKDCVLKGLIDVPLSNVYEEVGKLSHVDRGVLVKDCEKCQRSQSAVSEVEEGVS